MKKLKGFFLKLVFTFEIDEFEVTIFKFFLVKKIINNF